MKVKKVKSICINSEKYEEEYIVKASKVSGLGYCTFFYCQYGGLGYIDFDEWIHYAFLFVMSIYTGRRRLCLHNDLSLMPLINEMAKDSLSIIYGLENKYSSCFPNLLEVIFKQVIAKKILIQSYYDYQYHNIECSTQKSMCFSLIMESYCEEYGICYYNVKKTYCIDEFFDKVKKLM